MTATPKTPLNAAVRQLSFATSVAAALSISACGQQPPQQQATTRICTDPTGARIPDQNCHRSGGAGGGALWYFGAAALASTAYGRKASGGSYTAPDRSGFGASARGSSGG